MISCPKVHRPWVSARKPHIYDVVDVVEMLTISRRASVHHVDMESLLGFENIVGQRRPIVPEICTIF